MKTELARQTEVAKGKGVSKQTLHFLEILYGMKQMGWIDTPSDKLFIPDYL